MSRYLAANVPACILSEDVHATDVGPRRVCGAWTGLGIVAILIHRKEAVRRLGFRRGAELARAQFQPDPGWPVLRTESVTLRRGLGVATGFVGAAVLASREFALRGDQLAVGCSAAILVAASRRPRGQLGLRGRASLPPSCRYILFYFVISQLEAIVASTVIYLFPGRRRHPWVVFRGEVLDGRLVVGTGLVLTGIVVVSLRGGDVARSCRKQIPGG